MAADNAWTFQPQHSFEPKYIFPKQFSIIALLFGTFAHRVAPFESSKNRVSKGPAYDFGKTQLRRAPIN
jgi:hypothetical protein